MSGESENPHLSQHAPLFVISANVQKSRNNMSILEKYCDTDVYVCKNHFGESSRRWLSLNTEMVWNTTKPSLTQNS